MFDLVFFFVVFFITLRFKNNELIVYELIESCGMEWETRLVNKRVDSVSMMSVSLLKELKVGKPINKPSCSMK